MLSHELQPYMQAVEEGNAFQSHFMGGVKPRYRFFVSDMQPGIRPRVMVMVRLGVNVSLDF